MMYSIKNYREYLNYWEKLKQEVPFYAIFALARCKYCGSKNINRYGSTKNTQTWWCKDCQRKFSNNSTFPHMKTPMIQIALVLGMYWEGMPVDAIRRNLYILCNNYPSHSTIYEWINRFASKAKDEAKNYRPKVGNEWIAKEMIIKVKGKNFWIIDIIDPDTRFILATKLSKYHKIDDIKQLMEAARDVARKMPERVLTNGWKGYRDGIELAYGAESKHIQIKTLSDQLDVELKEWWYDMLRDRAKVMRSMENEDVAQFMQEGWLIHYNYFRPQEALIDKTPAEKSGIKYKPGQIGFAKRLSFDQDFLGRF